LSSEPQAGQIPNGLRARAATHGACSRRTASARRTG